MSAHTPGPWNWVVLGHSPACQLVGSDGTQILTATANDGCEADDNLIAAAPELLEALEALVSEVSGNAARGNPASVYWGSVTAAQNVINKVREP